jgi:Tfp pilus assembly protein PilX
MIRAVPPIRSTAGQHGYALVLVMVALITLTIMGVSQITATQLDMAITQNFRHHKQLQYGAITAADHGRELIETGSFDPEDTWGAAMELPGHCITGWISNTSSNAVATPDDLVANTMTLSSYETDFCAGICVTNPPAGWGLGQDNPYAAFTIDFLGTGSMINATADAQAGSMLFTVGKMSCDGL